MSLETRARGAAEGIRSATTIDPEAGLDRLRRVHRRRTVSRVAGVGIAAALAVFVAGPDLLGGRDRAEPAPAGPSSSTQSPPSTASPSSAAERLDTTSWTTYTSDQYGFEVGHPPDWDATPATRDWTFEEDAQDIGSSALDSFVSPDGEVGVSVWHAPLDVPGTFDDSTTDLRVWVEAYCEAGGSEPCSPIRDRTVELCVEAKDCHPGVLVRFESDVQAFFLGGGIYDPAITVVSVWRPESHSSVEPYGGSQRLLEAFLSTMGVWPASTPVEERECYGGPPGLRCPAIH